jgi:hypothetical protein
MKQNREFIKFHVIDMLSINYLQMDVAFEVPTDVVISVVIFWDIAPCSPYSYRLFGRVISQIMVTYTLDIYFYASDKIQFCINCQLNLIT